MDAAVQCFVSPFYPPHLMLIELRNRSDKVRVTIRAKERRECQKCELYYYDIGEITTVSLIKEQLYYRAGILNVNFIFCEERQLLIRQHLD